MGKAVGETPAAAVGTTALPRKSLSRIHAVEEYERKTLRQDLQDEQDEFGHTEIFPNGEGLFLMPHPFFHPVNPVKIHFFNGIVPAKDWGIFKNHKKPLDERMSDVV